jgi:pyruvate/2-oxoglutarate dehydrogenase complex dihydrolipoamide acyltransferase (E2) component
MFRRVWLMGIAVCVAGQAFGQEPATAQPAAPVPATPAPAPANASTTVAKVDETSASSPEAAAAAPEGKLDADKIMAAQKAGYQIRNEDGQTVLCRRELQTGSRVRYKTSCMTPGEWEQLQSDTAQSLRSIERRRVGPNNN